MSAVAEARKHPPATREDAFPATLPRVPDLLWVSMMDKLKTHMQDREGLYRRLAR